MNILHITPSSNGYEEVKLLANSVNRKNQLAVIEKDGQVLMTGGYLINDTPEIRAILDNIDRDKQYEFVQSFKSTPMVKFYYEDEE